MSHDNRPAAVEGPVQHDVRTLVERLRCFDHPNAEGEALLQEAADEIERLRALTFCGCGDQFSAHDPGTCGACMASATCGQEIAVQRAVAEERARLRGYFCEALEDTGITWPGEVDILYDKCFGAPYVPDEAA